MKLENKNVIRYVEQCVSGMLFPARKNQIIEYARARCVSDDIVVILGRIPNIEYESENQAMEEIRKIYE